MVSNTDARKRRPDDPDVKPDVAHGVDWFLGYINPGVPKVALDIGCGTGWLARELHGRGYTVDAIDISAAVLKQARVQTQHDMQRLMYLHFDIEKGNSNNLPHDSYGLITCRYVYAHLESPPTFLRRVAQLLAPRGIFVLVTPVCEEVSSEEMAIASSQSLVELLPLAFDQRAMRSEHGIVYFVGELPSWPV